MQGSYNSDGEAATAETARGPGALGVKRRIWAAAAMIAGSAVFLLAEFIAAAAWSDPPYNYTYHYISGLGVRGPLVALGQLMNSPLADVMNTGFFLFGICYLIGTALLAGWRGWSRITGLALGAMVAVGGVFLALHPGTGEPPAGEVDYHGLGALASIVGGNLLVTLLGFKRAQIGIGERAGTIIRALGPFGLISFGAFLAVASSGANILVGLIERLAVYPVTLGFIVAGVSLWRANGRNGGHPRPDN